jgi:ubiquinone/menaquinone biosynthesis C-methylase UbiE
MAMLYDLVLSHGERRGMRALRAQTLAAARGATLEIGAGTGLNLPHYPAGVTELVLTEPDPAMARRLRRRVEGAGHAPGRVTVTAAGAERLPFADAGFATVVTTMVLCTVADPEAAAAELRRVLAPGGTLLFIEHVRAAEHGAAARQHRWDRPWAAIAGGCRCTRDTAALLERHFTITALSRQRWRGMPRIVQPLIAGRAAATP